MAAVSIRRMLLPSETGRHWFSEQPSPRREKPLRPMAQITCVTSERQPSCSPPGSAISLVLTKHREKSGVPRRAFHEPVPPTLLAASITRGGAGPSGITG
jgi:hypothetical protein